MKTRSTITKLIAMTMAVAAMAVIGSICWTTEAQHTRLIFATDYGVWGFVHGQTARFSVAYPSTTEESTAPVRAQVTLYDARGNEVARSREVEVLPRQFGIFDFDRDDLPLAGEPGTGRLEVRAGIQVIFMDGSVRHVKLPVTREVWDTRTGSNSGGDYFTGTVTVCSDGAAGCN